MAKNKHKVVIVGAGFGGIKAALELVDDPRFDVTLISENADFRIFGTLYHVATGGAKRVASIPLTDIFNDKKLEIVQSKMTELDRDKRTVKTKNGKTFEYDALVIGIGVVTNYFGIKGLEKYSFSIKTPEGAERLKRHLHKQLMEDNEPDLNYVIVGGGPTGVELAGVLPAYLKRVMEQHDLPRRKIHVDLVESSPRLLPRMPKDISKMVARNLRKNGVKLYLKTVVQAQTADALMVNNKPIRSHTVIWTAGVTNNPFFSKYNFQLMKGKVRVDHFLQAEPGIYVIGDNADTPYSGMAQTALLDGKYVAENMKRLADGEDPVPYVAKKPIYVMPAGPKWAAVLWGKFRMYGRLGWFLRRAADFIAYNDYEPWNQALERFMAEGDHEEFCPMCADDLAKVRYLSGEVV